MQLCHLQKMDVAFGSEMFSQCRSALNSSGSKQKTNCIQDSGKTITSIHPPTLSPCSRSPFQLSQGERRGAHTRRVVIQSHLQFRMAMPLLVFVPWEDLCITTKNHVDTRRTCKHRRAQLAARFKPTIFLMRGDSADHCTTLPHKFSPCRLMHDNMVKNNTSLPAPEFLQK